MSNPSFHSAAPRRLRIGTRQSPLALTQTEWVAARLRAADPSLHVELCPMVTTGDQVHGPLHEQGGKGLFVKELDQALLQGTIDCAVHSLKDVPGVLADGIAMAAIPEREAPWDVLIGREAWTIATLPKGARVGTSSPRRRWQLLVSRPDLDVVLLRGNVQTRLRKLSEGVCDATILAAAGLHRLGVTPPHATSLTLAEMVPAVGQGALAITTRAADMTETAWLAEAIGAPRDTTAVQAERALLAAIGGDCHTPLAGHAEWVGDRLRLTAFLATPDGRCHARLTMERAAAEAERLGREMAEALQRECHTTEE